LIALKLWKPFACLASRSALLLEVMGFGRPPIRARCVLSEGYELDDDDQFIDVYDRDLPQAQGEKAALPDGESPSAITG
jgi:hypothetical protein